MRKKMSELEKTIKKNENFELYFSYHKVDKVDTMIDKINDRLKSEWKNIFNHFSTTPEIVLYDETFKLIYKKKIKANSL